MSEKKPRLFYYEGCYDAWTPAPDLVENILCLEMLDADDEIKIQFKRIDMTDQQFDMLMGKL